MIDEPWRIELTRAAQRDLRRRRVRMTLDAQARVLLVMRVLPRGRAYRD